MTHPVKDTFLYASPDIHHKLMHQQARKDDMAQFIAPVMNVEPKAQ